jgi:hypothetical protein
MWVCSKSKAYISFPTMQLEICCMTITDMAAARYAKQHTTHSRHTGLGQQHYSNFCYRRVFPHPSRFHFNTILSYKLAFLFLMRYKFDTQQSVIPPTLSCLLFLLIRRSSFSHIVTTAKWKKIYIYEAHD